MRYTATKIAGVTIIELEPERDHRGFTSRSFCARDFAEHGLIFDVTQTNNIFSYTRGTVRGLHRQIPPYAEAKLVRVTAGAVYDVIVDLRPDSPAYLRWMWQELTAASHRALYVPKGCAHGFLTLTDGVEMLYHMSEFFEASHNTGVRWNDPAFRVEWPFEPLIVSEKDAGYADYRPVG